MPCFTYNKPISSACFDGWAGGRDTCRIKFPFSSTNASSDSNPREKGACRGEICRRHKYFIYTYLDTACVPPCILFASQSIDPGLRITYAECFFKPLFNCNLGAKEDYDRNSLVMCVKRRSCVCSTKKNNTLQIHKNNHNYSEKAIKVAKGPIASFHRSRSTGFYFLLRV